MPVVDNDLVFFAIKNSVLIERAADLVRSTHVIVRKVDCSELMSKSKYQLTLPAVCKKADPAGLILPFSVESETARVSGNAMADIRCGGGDATKRGTGSC